MGKRMLALAGLAALTAFVPASAAAVTVTLGPPTLPSPGVAFYCGAGGGGCASETFVNTALGSGVTLTAPLDGTVVGWRVSGSRTNGGTLQLQTVHNDASGYAATRTSEDATAVDGTLNTASMPIAAGDTIGIRLANTGGPGSEAGVYSPNTAGAVARQFVPGLVVGGLSAAGTELTGYSFGFNAVVELDLPLLSTLNPSVGRTEGGETVTIDGLHFGTAPVVKFGTTEAVVKSATNTQITAIAPPGPAGSTEVTVTTDAGTSAPGLPFTRTGSTPPPPPAPPPPAGGPGDTTTPVIREILLSPATFVAANFGPSIAARVSTRVTLQLSEAASVSFRVHRQLPGVRRGRRCVARTQTARGRACKRYVAVHGTFTRASPAGASVFTFTGRVGGRRLAVGRYRLTATARDAAGNTSQGKAANFRIVAR